MTTAYTSLLGLALPVTGELSGTWGSVVNDSITSLLDTSVAGTTNVSADSNVTLTTTTGASNQARQAILLFSGARTAIRTVTAPAQSKIYTVINATTGGFAVQLVGAGPTTGLTIPNGASAVVAWNGSDFVEIGTSSIGNLTVNGTLTVTGVSIFSAGSAAAPAITTTGDTNTGIFFPAADTIAFAEGGAEVMRLDSSGNMGLGVTPSGWSGFKVLESTAGNSVYFGSSQASLGSNAYNDGGGWRYKTTAPAGVFTNVQGSYAWFNAPSGTAGNAITFTQAMTLDASGNLGVGTTSPNAVGSSWKGLSVGVAGIQGGGSGSFGSNLQHNAYYNGSNWIRVQTGGTAHMEFDGTGYKFFSDGSGSAGSFTPTERARIDSSGNLLVGKTTNNDTSFGCVIVPYDGATGRFKATGDNSGSGASFQITDTSGNNTFLVRPNGNVLNANNSYGSLSDAKLKENIVDATPKLAGLMQVKVRNYNLIGSDKKQLGVVAQELEQVFPAMVDESFDMDADGNNLSTTTKSVKYSVFVPMLIKAMQEQQAIIENLKARLDAANL